MPSHIAWLDASADDQRRMRDIIRLFSDRDSRDELGLGQVRDALSDALFPGTTVLLTRARYVLFVPWCFQLAEGKPNPVGLAERHERELIKALRSSGHDDLTGLLGARVGQALQTLPSTIYWTALRRWAIVGEGYAWKTDVFTPITHEVDGDDERSRRGPAAWSQTIPAAPDGFPSSVPGAFALTHAEAAWLRERILDSAPGTVLAHLMGNRPTKGTSFPWSDEAVLDVPGDAAELLLHAEAFSTVMHGASLLYNLLLAEEYENVVPEDRRRLDAPVAEYHTRLAEWSERVAAPRVASWDIDEFWRWVLDESSAHIAPASVTFISNWAELVRSADLSALASNAEAKGLIRDRERRQKGAQARLGNPKRLSAWSGAAGAGALAYRWTTVRDIAIDIHDGLGRDA